MTACERVEICGKIEYSSWQNGNWMNIKHWSRSRCNVPALGRSWGRRRRDMFTENHDDTHFHTQHYIIDELLGVNIVSTFDAKTQVLRSALFHLIIIILQFNNISSVLRWKFFPPLLDCNQDFIASTFSRVLKSNCRTMFELCMLLLATRSVSFWGFNWVENVRLTKFPQLQIASRARCWATAPE